MKTQDKEKILTDVEVVAPIVQELYRAGVISVGPDKKIQLTSELFLEMFPAYDLKSRDDKDWPFEAFVEENGKRYFCLMNEQEAQNGRILVGDNNGD